MQTQTQAMGLLGGCWEWEFSTWSDKDNWKRKRECKTRIVGCICVSGSVCGCNHDHSYICISMMWCLMTWRKASRSQKLPLHGPFEPTRCVVGFNISFCPSVNTVLYSSFVRSLWLFNFFSLKRAFPTFLFFWEKFLQVLTSFSVKLEFFTVHCTVCCKH